MACPHLQRVISNWAPGRVYVHPQRSQGLLAHGALLPRQRLPEWSQGPLAHGALLTTYQGDTTMATRALVDAIQKGGGARIER